MDDSAQNCDTRTNSPEISEISEANNMTNDANAALEDFIFEPRIQVRTTPKAEKSKESP